MISYITVYVCLPYYEWQEIKKSKKTIYNDCEEYYSTLSRDFIKAKVCEKLHIHCEGDPVYCFVSKPPNHLVYPPKRAILKIKVPSSKVVCFDDHVYVHMLNDLNNNWLSLEECKKAYQNIFENDTTRNLQEPRAFIPRITYEMIRKVWIYRNSKRLCLRSKNNNKRLRPQHLKSLKSCKCNQCDSCNIS